MHYEYHHHQQSQMYMDSVIVHSYTVPFCEVVPEDQQDTFVDVPEPSSFGTVEKQSYRRDTYYNRCGSIAHIGIVVLGSYGFLQN